jgi:hypothetical protein
MTEAKTIPVKYIFLDVVGFTHDRSVEAQSDIIHVLNGIVESSIQAFEIRKENVMFLPAGDDIGIALLNVGSPYDIHLSIAQRIVREVYKHSANTTNKMRKFEVRVGINSNTDNLITDINGNQNVAGAGVNLTPRIMKMADGNQILVSQSVFNDLLLHEKYNSSFKPFRASIKQNSELPIYQFISNACEGLNTAVPRALQGFSKPAEPQTEAAATREQAVIPETIEVIKPAAEQLPITQFPRVKPAATNETQSYLKGILPEPERTEPAKTEWIKNKTETESLTFLEQAEPRQYNRSLMWASLIILMLGGAGFGAWFWMNKPPATLMANKTSVNTAASQSEKPAPAKPESTQNEISNQIVAETNPPSSKPDRVFTPTESRESKTEIRVRNNVVRRQPAPATKQAFVSRPVVQRTVAQSPKAKPQPKPQVVKPNKQKPSKRLTLDDLIGDN